LLGHTQRTPQLPTKCALVSRYIEPLLQARKTTQMLAT
jgi:hypothetical protein